jgi:hypothetical protein
VAGETLGVEQNDGVRKDGEEVAVVVVRDVGDAKEEEEEEVYSDGDVGGKEDEDEIPRDDGEVEEEEEKILEVVADASPSPLLQRQSTSHLKKPKIKSSYKQSKQATIQFKASSKTPNPNPL